MIAAIAFRGASAKCPAGDRGGYATCQKPNQVYRTNSLTLALPTPGASILAPIKYFGKPGFGRPPKLGRVLGLKVTAI